MSDTLLANIEYCGSFVKDFQGLLLYTHIPAAIATLALSLIVFLKDHRSLLSRILFGISLSFSAWVILNLLIWLRFDNAGIVMAAWAPIEVIKVFTFFLCWYFVYSFIEKKDFSGIQKIAWGLLLVTTFVLSITPFNIHSYNLSECIAIENTLFSNLTSWTQILISVLLVVYLLLNLFKTKLREDRKRLTVLSVGVIVFVLSFFILGKISEATQNYTYEAIGLFGMVFFTVCMAYLIFKYSLFNVKVFSAQVLVVALIILTGSQLTFVSGYAVILASITTFSSIVFGYFLVKSVKNEIEQRNKLEDLTTQLEHANNTLAAANDKLKTLDKLKTEFLSLASHQLRTPLTIIKGYASMLLEGSFGPLQGTQEEGVKPIYASAQGLTNIVEDLLNVSKIEQGGMQYELAPTDVSKIVKDLYKEMTIPAENKKLAFTLEVPPNDTFMATIDGLKMKQVFLNLTDNSIKYTQEGFVKIGLTREGKNIVFYVTDSGVGISPETKAKLFEKFSRGEGGKLNTTGSGLGLYLAREITRAHKGDIEILSEGLGKGSTFRVLFPGSGAAVIDGMKTS